MIGPAAHRAKDDAEVLKCIAEEVAQRLGTDATTLLGRFAHEIDQTATEASLGTLLAY